MFARGAEKGFPASDTNRIVSAQCGAIAQMRCQEWKSAACAGGDSWSTSIAQANTVRENAPALPLEARPRFASDAARNFNQATTSRSIALGPVSGKQDLREQNRGAKTAAFQSTSPWEGYQKLLL
jgi:hypothetical protein